MNVSHESGSAFKFHALLFELDQRATERVRAAGCQRCGGPLYAAHYARKPRGLTGEASEMGRYDKRLSLCCGREGCRARATPPSVRFLGRRVYSAIAVLVLSLRGEERVQAQQASNVERSAQAPSWLTRRRWRWWWCSGLLVLPWFAALRGHLSVSLDAQQSPECLLSQFTGSIHERCRRLLVLLSPLTTHSVLLEHSRMAMLS
jgi:hypothetical protein